MALGIIVPTSDLLSIKRSINFFIQARCAPVCVAVAEHLHLRAPRLEAVICLHLALGTACPGLLAPLRNLFAVTGSALLCRMSTARRSSRRQWG